MDRLQKTTVVTLALATCMVSLAIAESRKEYRFVVGPNANISVDTQYGAISVKPGTSSEVVVTAISQSDKTEVDNMQRGNRVEIASHLLSGADHQSGRVDYELLVPADATISLRSSNGPLSAENLRGDLTFEGTDAVVNVQHVSNGHVHVRTMSGPITLTDVSNGHIELSTISGPVVLKSVTGPFVRADSGSGRIFYAGDFGSGGDYKLMTHTGDIEAIVPGNTSADFSAHSMLGKVHNDLDLMPQHSRYALEQGRSFFGSVGQAASKVVLRSFRGQIRLKQQ
ncbi:MAG: DUF4097 family beta strand repeat-containing protein [Terriglobales bacterium]|jgi:hypothetical protein